MAGAVVLLKSASAPLRRVDKRVAGIVCVYSRAATPTAVLSVPVMLNKSAACQRPYCCCLGVEVQRSSANGGVEVASLLRNKRKPTNSCVPAPGGETLKSAAPLSSVEVGIAPGGRRGDRLRFRQKPEAEKREYDEKWWSCFQLNQWIHRCYLSFSRWLTL